MTCVARGVPPGWGEPVFDKLEADLAKACLSIPAAKGFESGAGDRGESVLPVKVLRRIFRRGFRGEILHAHLLILLERLMDPG